MSTTKIARRSDALHYGEYGRRTLCDMVARTEDERDRLRIIAKSMWERVLSEYPQGGFPDMGMIEYELRNLGVIPWPSLR